MFPDTLTESLSDEVIRQASVLKAQERYLLFQTYAQKAEEVWLLKGSEGFVMMADSETERLPVFPHRDLAIAWRDSMIENNALPEDTVPESVTLAVFVSTWLPGLEKNAMSLVIFPGGPGSQDHVLTAGELQADLSDND